MNKRVLALDYGLKRIGLALGDFENRLATKFEVIENKSDEFVYQGLKKIVDDWGIDVLLFGLPLNMREGQVLNLVHERLLKFVDFLEGKLDVEIVFMDERLSTFEAEEIIEKNGFERFGNKDSLAAQVILQRWLDTFCL